MASTTTNLALIKPAGTDKIRIAQINSNMDAIDTAFGAVGSTAVQTQINNLQDGLAIVSNNNTHAAIAAGQFVYVKNHGTLAEGLYTANSAIAQNATLSSSNLTADESGGLNALNGQLTNNLQIPQKVINTTTAAAITSVASLDTVLSTSGSYYVETNSAVRTTLLSLGLIPVNEAGIYEIRKITNGYYFLNFSTYSDKKYFSCVDNGTVKTWVQIADNSDITPSSGTVTAASNVTLSNFSCKKSANIVTINGAAVLTGSFAGKDALIMTLPTGFRPSSTASIFVYTTYGGAVGMYHFWVKTDGTVVTQVGGNEVTGTVFFNVSFCI